MKYITFVHTYTYIYSYIHIHYIRTYIYTYLRIKLQRASNPDSRGDISISLPNPLSCGINHLARRQRVQNAKRSVRDSGKFRGTECSTCTSRYYTLNISQRFGFVDTRRFSARHKAYCLHYAITLMVLWRTGRWWGCRAARRRVTSHRLFKSDNDSTSRSIASFFPRGGDMYTDPWIVQICGTLIHLVWDGNPIVKLKKKRATTCECDTMDLKTRLFFTKVLRKMDRIARPPNSPTFDYSLVLSR